MLTSRLSLATFVPFACLSAPGLVGQTPTPIQERPAIWREVTGVIDGVYPSNPQFTRPHIPAIRTTRDGRLGVIVEGGNGLDGTPRFILLTPEKMTARLLANPPSAFTVANSSANWLQDYVDPVTGQAHHYSDPVASHVEYATGGQVAHACLWDDAGPTALVNGNDQYDLKVFVTQNLNNNTTFFVTPIQVIVTNPKTANASIALVSKTGPTVTGHTFIGAGGFEPIIVGDGRLLVGRVGSNNIGADIIYSYYSGGATADVTGWAVLHPISHAYWDSPVHTQFPFAFQQFRDAAGTLIGDNVDVGGSYPWMDRGAKNLFLEGIHDSLHYYAGGSWQHGRYALSLVSGDYWGYFYPNVNDPQEDGGLHQGITVLGLWTGGKMVQIDNLNNDTDYAVGAGDSIPLVLYPNGYEFLGPQQRMVTLFNEPSAPNGSDQLRLGYGRATQRMPHGENDNGNIIDSLENKFTYRTFMHTDSFHDVAWHLSNRQTDELAFDGFLDPDTLILANMTGALTLPSQQLGMQMLDHHTGWDDIGHTFSTSDIRFQNAATSAATWSVPQWGTLTGNGRVEPAATGGIHGKGLWLDGGSGLVFTIPAQATGQVASHDWYCGVFVDSRFADDTTARRLLTFPDSTSIQLYGRHQVLYVDGLGNTQARITLPAFNSASYSGTMDDLLPARGWAHLAFQIRHGGHDVEFLLDGMPFHRWHCQQGTMFQPLPGALTLGKTTAAEPGFRGWTDDLELIAHTMDPETAANHAGGTIVGLPTGYVGALATKFAARFPSWTHEDLTAQLRQVGEATFPLYACYFDYLHDNGATAATLPRATAPLRQSFHFPEGPLFHNAPRPDTTHNHFCTSCHNAGGQAGLGLSALTFTGANEVNDPRRQPAQPPANLFGWLSAGLVQGASGAQPAVTTPAPPTGQPVDPLLLPTWVGPAVVQTFTVLDGNGNELTELKNGDELDPARLGANSFQFRANLDSAQGQVVMDLDGGPLMIGTSPYVCPAAPVVLTAGPHTVKATVVNGAQVKVDFTVAGSSIRIVAGYQSDFRGNSPRPGWLYCWNKSLAVNQPRGYVALNWNPSANQYTAFGLAYPETGTECPFGALSASGGHPGQGNTQGPAADRYVIAGYQAKFGGYYGLVNGSLSSAATSGSNGCTVIVYVQTSAGTTQKYTATFAPGSPLAIPATSLGFLAAGDTIWFCVGPTGSDVSDAFSMDFDVRYWEQSF